MGSMFVNVRLQLYQNCIIPSLLYNLEGWNKLTKGEIKKLERIQAKALCKILDLPRTTPYIGLLNETGLWRIEERLIYRKIMLYHNIINSSEKRMCKKIICEQEQSNDPDTFYQTVENMCKALGIDIQTVKKEIKSKVKSLLKEKINIKMKNIVQVAGTNMKKLRFIKEASNSKQKPYILELDGYEALKTIKLKLNMTPIYGNFKGDVTKPQRCPYCNDEDDTTEHLLTCSVFQPNGFTIENLENDDNPELWRQLNEMVSFNLKNRCYVE